MRKFLLVLCLLFACGCGRSREVKAFDAKLGDYLKLEPALLAHNSRGYLKPKAVVLDLTTGQIDEDVFKALPDDLRASSPADVKSVVWIEWRKRFEGGGKDLSGKPVVGTSFNAWDAYVVVVDVSGSEPVVSFTDAYRQTLPKAYRDSSGGGHFKLTRSGDGWRIETASEDPQLTEHKLLHPTARGRAPSVGAGGENFGERPAKEVIECLTGLPREK